MTLHTAPASSQPQAVATTGIHYAFRVMEEHTAEPAYTPAAEPVEPKRLDLLSHRRRRRARLAARW
ncbi:MAG: hypothetical protein RLO80_11545 [Hyphomonas sp.]